MAVVAAQMNQNRYIVWGDAGERSRGANDETTHGLDGISGLADHLDTITAVSAYLGEGMGRLPVCEAGDGEEIDGLVGHVMRSSEPSGLTGCARESQRNLVSHRIL